MAGSAGGIAAAPGRPVVPADPAVLMTVLAGPAVSAAARAVPVRPGAAVPGLPVLPAAAASADRAVLAAVPLAVWAEDAPAAASGAARSAAAVEAAASTQAAVPSMAEAAAAAGKIG